MATKKKKLQRILILQLKWNELDNIVFFLGHLQFNLYYPPPVHFLIPIWVFHVEMQKLTEIA